MPNRIECAGLQIDAALQALVVNDIAPGTGVEPDTFWRGVADIWNTLGPDNRRLLAERESLQAQIVQVSQFAGRGPAAASVVLSAARDAR